MWILVEINCVSSSNLFFQLQFLVSVFRLVRNKYFWSVFHWQFLINYTFSTSLNFGKSYNFTFTYNFLAFFCIEKSLVFIIFICFLFNKVSTESGTDDKKLSVELYVDRMSIRILVYLSWRNQVLQKVVSSLLKIRIKCWVLIPYYL